MPQEKIKAAAKEVMRRGKIEIGVSIDNFGKSETDVNLIIYTTSYIFVIRIN